MGFFPAFLIRPYTQTHSHFATPLIILITPYDQIRIDSQLSGVENARQSVTVRARAIKLQLALTPLIHSCSMRNTQTFDKIQVQDYNRIEVFFSFLLYIEIVAGAY